MAWVRGGSLRGSPRLVAGIGSWGGARVRLLPPSLAELTARSLNLQWAVPSKGQLRIDEALGILSCTKRCSLVRVVLPASEFLPLSRYAGGGGLCLFPYLTMPSLEGSIRFHPTPQIPRVGPTTRQGRTRAGSCSQTHWGGARGQAHGFWSQLDWGLSPSLASYKLCDFGQKMKLL